MTQEWNLKSHKRVYSIVAASKKNLCSINKLMKTSDVVVNQKVTRLFFAGCIGDTHKSVR